MYTKIKEVREKSCLTQVEVANQAEISPRQYQRYEAGESTPPYATMKLIAKALNSTVEELF